MKRQTQGLLLAFLGAVLLRIAVGDAHLRYVADWMKWPILLSGVAMLLLAIGPTLRDPDATDGGHGHGGDEGQGDGHGEGHGEGHGGERHGEGHGGVPRATWLLALPGLIAFVVSPPELGADLAQRRANQSAAAAPAAVAPLAADGVNELPLEEFVWRAQSEADSLVDRTVALTGFVSHQGDRWFVTRVSIGCCAADALAFRVEVDDDAPRPPQDRWVRVTGTYVEGTGLTLRDDAVVVAQDVTEVDKPRQTYG